VKDFPVSPFNVHENLIEALLELQQYPDVQSVLTRYDDISLPKSACICYSVALLKARAVADKLVPCLLLNDKIRRNLDIDLLVWFLKHYLQKCS